jgi:phytoene desaturase
MPKQNKINIAVIGAGFAGLSAAALLAKDGHQVTLYEKNNGIGGRARLFSEQGFVFDMGPSWYWMPEVFENFYNQFGYTAADFYDLKRLDPSYKVFWQDSSNWDIPAHLNELSVLFEKYERGSGKRLEAFMLECKTKYEAGMQKFVWKPALSITEFADLQLLKEVFKLDLFKSVSKNIRKYFKHPKLIELLEFPVLFLGAKPNETPALYTLMNYADMGLGTWYPMGGMHQIIKAFEKIAIEQGVTIKTNSSVEGIVLKGKSIDQIVINNQTINVDNVVCAADYHFFEQNIVPESHRIYTPNYWDTRTMAPSSLLFYLGLDKKIEGLQHHNLFFDKDFTAHAEEIYTTHIWPKDPLFYACCPSKTDATLAPEGHENLFILIPVSTYIKDDKLLHQQYLDKVIDRMEKLTKQEIRSHIVYQRSYAHQDFIDDYNAYRGNAYGLANTLRQTAFLKPKMTSKKIDNLIYTGQLTVPGPGMPPSIISGQLAASLINK